MSRIRTVAAIMAIIWLANSSVTFAVDDIAGSPKRFISDWVAAFNENDSKLLLAFYEQSENTELIMSAGVRHHGYLAIQKAYTDDAKKVRFYDSTARIISSRTLGDTALVTFEHSFKTEFIEGKSHWQVHIRTTTVLGHTSGQWKIALEHSSPIHGIERYAPIENEIH